MPEFAFDLKLNAAIRVNAATEAEVRQMLVAAFDAADANFGAWPNGDPVTGETSLDGEPALFERDGETLIGAGEAFQVYSDDWRGFRVVRIHDGAECAFHGDDQCERFRDNYRGDEIADDPREFVTEADEFGEWCEREGELPA